MQSGSRVVVEGVFDPEDFEAELEGAPSNREVGTRLWFENHRVRVWEVLLQPGERGSFHCHSTDYFWTVVEAGLGLQRISDGRFAVRQYQIGDTMFLENMAEASLIHDLENVGDTALRFVTVEIL